MSYTWEKPFTIASPLISATITVTGVPEINQKQTINVVINNARTTQASGKVTVEIKKADNTLVATLESALTITIAAGGNWTKQYTWTPNAAGDFKVVVTYAE